MAMIYGSVEFQFNGKKQTAVLSERGWSFTEKVIADTLNIHCDPSRYGPADGDPHACAVRDAAELLGGKGSVTPLKSAPPGTIY